MGLFQIKARN